MYHACDGSRTGRFRAFLVVDAGRPSLVANSWIRVPDERWLELELVGEVFDAADDWIVEHVHANDIVITADIPLRLGFEAAQQRMPWKGHLTVSIGRKQWE